jgi:uncharacterized protein (TIGR02646 family)
MRNVAKLPEPSILIEKKEEWKAALLADPSDANKNHYRHPQIKEALKAETHDKCVYCESKIGHNCPGDIEHKIPKSIRSDLTFEWDNMTMACSECNRRKGEYYTPACMFLDPNTDDVESLVLHLGTFVFNRPGNIRSEVTVRILQLDSLALEGRPKIIGRKLEKLEAIRHLVERIAATNNPTLKSFLREQLTENCEPSSEFSGMVKAYVEGLPDRWHGE